MRELISTFQFLLSNVVLYLCFLSYLSATVIFLTSFLSLTSSRQPIQMPVSPQSLQFPRLHLIQNIHSSWQSHSATTSYLQLYHFISRNSTFPFTCPSRTKIFQITISPKSCWGGSPKLSVQVGSISFPLFTFHLEFCFSPITSQHLPWVPWLPEITSRISNTAPTTFQSLPACNGIFFLASKPVLWNNVYRVFGL